MDNSLDVPVQRALALLNSPKPLWESVTGTVSSWFDEDLLDIGRARYWQTKHPSVPGLVALGSDGYLITLDAVAGIVLDVRIIIEAQVARRHTIANLRVDVPINDSTFIQPDSVSGYP